MKRSAGARIDGLLRGKALCRLLDEFGHGFGLRNVDRVTALQLNEVEPARFDMECCARGGIMRSSVAALSRSRSLSRSARGITATAKHCSYCRAPRTGSDDSGSLWRATFPLITDH